jgi:hypothetical protein
LACPIISSDKAAKVAIAFMLFYLIYLYKAGAVGALLVKENQTNH